MNDGRLQSFQSSKATGSQCYLSFSEEMSSSEGDQGEVVQKSVQRRQENQILGFLDFLVPGGCLVAGTGRVVLSVFFSMYNTCIGLG